MWFFFASLTCLTLLLFLFDLYKGKVLQESIGNSSFLQVTYRDFSLFLWQHPEYMKVNYKGPSEYLKYVKEDKIGILPEFAESYVEAPPEILFRFHLWRELLEKDLAKRKITPKEFQEFLSYSREWSLEAYVNLIEADKEDISDELPFVVRLAFQGWKNYFKEGEKINQVKFTYKTLNAFLMDHPHLSRNYWKNIFKNSSPHYLIYQTQGKIDVEDAPKEEEIHALLKLYYYNFTQN